VQLTYNLHTIPIVDDYSCIHLVEAANCIGLFNDLVSKSIERIYWRVRVHDNESRIWHPCIGTKFIPATNKITLQNDFGSKAKQWNQKVNEMIKLEECIDNSKYSWSMFEWVQKHQLRIVEGMSHNLFEIHIQNNDLSLDSFILILNSRLLKRIIPHHRRLALRETARNMRNSADFFLIFIESMDFWQYMYDGQKEMFADLLWNGRWNELCGDEIANENEVIV